MPSSPETVMTDAVVVSVLGPHTFRLSMTGNGHQMTGHMPLKLQKELLPLHPGDPVRVEMTPYDMDKAKILQKLPQMPPDFKFLS